MEALWKSLRKGSPTARTEEDHVYENIEAPKFVDFTAPDRSRPDDRSWFCARIGCDQNHEEVDPDVLHKNFVLRVMAARSPNVRLQKALSRHHAPSAKCPRSAPAKSARSRTGRLGEKAGNSSRLKNHPVAGLSSSTPKPAKRPPAVERAMTTPRNRARPTGEEPFRSVKISKPPEPLQKSRAVAKVLSFQTPKKSEKELVSEISAGVKKLNMGTPRSDKPSREDRDALRVLEAEECPERALSSSMAPPGDPAEPDVFAGEETEDSSEFDENKENASVVHAAAHRDENLNPATSEMENRQKNSCDGPRKATATSGKNHHKPVQGAKYRALKPTNPKPFRLRTDERGILREKNLERGKPQKEACIVKPGGKTEEKGSSLQRLLKPQSKGTAPEEKEEKKKKKKKSSGSLRGGDMEGTRRVPPSVLRPREEAAMSMASASSAKKALTVPKAPNFNKVNVPKGCIKRFDLAN